MGIGRNGRPLAFLERFEGYLIGSPESYRFSIKVIGVIALLSIVSGIVLLGIGEPLLAGLAVSLGAYLVLCSVLFIFVPLVTLDVVFD